jgi:hypothetical protein
VEPEIGSLGNAGLLGWQGEEKRARRIADANKPDLPPRLCHFVQPKRVFRDITSAVISDLDRIAEIALNALRAEVYLLCARRRFSRRHQQSSEQNDKTCEAIFPVHRLASSLCPNEARGFLATLAAAYQETAGSQSGTQANQFSELAVSRPTSAMERRLSMAPRQVLRLEARRFPTTHSVAATAPSGSRFRESDLLRKLFETVAARCTKERLIGREAFAVDGG